MGTARPAGFYGGSGVERGLGEGCSYPAESAERTECTPCRECRADGVCRARAANMKLAKRGAVCVCVCVCMCVCGLLYACLLACLLPACLLGWLVADCGD